MFYESGGTLINSTGATLNNSGEFVNTGTVTNFGDQVNSGDLTIKLYWHADLIRRQHLRRRHEHP